MLSAARQIDFQYLSSLCEFIFDDGGEKNKNISLRIFDDTLCDDKQKAKVASGLRKK
jgi:hypothetical protein